MSCDVTYKAYIKRSPDLQRNPWVFTIYPSDLAFVIKSTDTYVWDKEAAFECQRAARLLGIKLAVIFFEDFNEEILK